MIKEIRSLGAANVESLVATKAVEELRTALTATLAAGTDPDGKKWAPRKEDDGRPYKNAASKLTVKNYGPLIRVAISGGEAYGQFGVRGAPKRGMIPEGGAGMPDSVSTALDKAAEAVLKDLTK